MEAQDQGTIRTIAFDGKDKAKYAEWADKVLAAAQLKGYRDVYTLDLKIPMMTEYLEGKTADGKDLSTAQKALYTKHEMAYSWLILCVHGDAFSEVADAKTEDFPFGSARQA